MDDEKLNMEIRKFLKKVGITSQREIETAIREGIAAKRISGDETLEVSVRLQLGKTKLDITIDGTIALA